VCCILPERFLDALFKPAATKLVRSDAMHEIPNFPFPSQNQQSAAARQELGQPIEMKTSGKSGDSKKAQGQR
jgi:hypothetical protein